MRAHSGDRGTHRSPLWPSNDTVTNRKRDNLRWRIVAVLLIASLLPLCLVITGASVVFSRLLMEKTLELHHNMVRGHAAAIDFYLEERLRALEMAARSHTLAHLSDRTRLQKVFETFNSSYSNAFVDLGVIDSTGRHLAYVGSYDLADKGYRQAEWFKSVMSEGAYLSDVFLGYRQVPHCVIAVRQGAGTEAWVIRATINNDSLYSLVRAGEVGNTGDAFIVNARGLFQTPSRRGNVLGVSPLKAPAIHQGVRDSRLRVSGVEMVQVTTWLKNNQWMLVVQQAEDEIMAPVRHATAVGAVVVMIAVLLLVVTAFLATWHLTNKIDRAREQRDRMSRDLIRSAKLASLGEMATGLAHEINNPLAIIDAEQTNVADQISDLDLGAEEKNTLMESVARCKRQVARCGGITAKMLRFGRKTDSSLVETDIAPLLKECVELMKKRAEVNNIELELRTNGELPELLIDGNELEQILVNLIGNSIQAIGKNGKIIIAAERIDGEVRLIVEDNGCGISPENLDRVFQPFFTTKPVGEGTGLGLSVCYGIVRGWRGTIEAKSAIGGGTVMSVHLPIPDKKITYMR